MIPAPRNNPDFNSHEWQDWFFQVWKAIGGSGGGSVADILSRPPTAIINKYSSGGTGEFIQVITLGGKQVNTAAMSANVLTQLINLTGPGVVSQLVVYNNSGTSTNDRTQVIIDGTIVYDSVVSNAGSGYGVYVIGKCSKDTTGGGAVYNDICFNTSFVLNVSSNTAGATVAAAYVARTI